MKVDEVTYADVTRLFGSALTVEVANDVLRTSDVVISVQTATESHAPVDGAEHQEDGGAQRDRGRRIHPAVPRGGGCSGHPVAVAAPSFSRLSNWTTGVERLVKTILGAIWSEGEGGGGEKQNNKYRPTVQLCRLIVIDGVKCLK